MTTGIVKTPMRRAVAAVVLVGAGVALAATVATRDFLELDLDPAQTQVDFTLSDILHTVHGTFKLKQGTIQFDPLSGRASGQVVVDAASGASGSRARDRKMEKDILESQQYSEIRFTPDRIEGPVHPQGESQIQIHGFFNLHGTDHEILVPAAVRMDGGALSATVHFDIPYVKWGLKNPSTLFLRVSDKVQIDLQAVGQIRAR